jgi:hypothetical protein
MTKIYVEPKVLVVGRELLAQCRELLKTEEEISLSPYSIMAKRGISYNTAQAVIVGTIETLGADGYAINYVRGKGYIIGKKEEPKAKEMVEPKDKKTIRCKSCGKHFSTKFDLEEHITLNHATQSE